MLRLCSTRLTFSISSSTSRCPPSTSRQTPSQLSREKHLDTKTNPGRSYGSNPWLPFHPKLNCNLYKFLEMFYTWLLHTVFRIRFILMRIRFGDSGFGSGSGSGSGSAYINCKVRPLCPWNIIIASHFSITQY